MNTKRNNYLARGWTLAAALALAALIGIGLPGKASASTSGGATIYNTVKVTYASGTASFFASANVSVTVNTIAAAPTVTNPSGQTVTAGTAVSYDYVVKSNSNGPDTYTTSALANTPTNVAAATGTSVTASVALWGGIALGSGSGAITIPFGTTGSLTAGTSTVQIGAANQYTVTTITPGSAASTDGSGNLVAEVPTTLTLTPIGAAPAITAGSVAAGTQVGEFKTAALTAALTAGNPTTAGTNGTYSTSYTITTTATDAGGSAVTYTTTGVTTTVPSPSLTISKYARNVTTPVAGSGSISYSGNTYYSSGVSGKPGETLEYLIRVTNTSTASATSVTVIDAVPAYTTYGANSTLLNGITVAGDGATSPLSGAGLLVDDNGSRSAGAAASGNLPASGVANITFRVQIQ